MRLCDIESTEIDWYVVDLVVSDRDRRLGRQLNSAERKTVIARLADTMSNAELAELLGINADTICQIRHRAKERAL